jgi:UDP-N-acetyl-D-mannosaminuronate dehydrogenase
MISMNDKTTCVIGLGYVGLSLAEAFSKHLRTIGFDIDGEKLEGLKRDNNEEGLEFTTDPTRIREADFVLISVSTPVAKSKEPDLSYVKSAAEITGKNLKKDAIVVLESTVYPGVAEEVVALNPDKLESKGSVKFLFSNLGYSQVTYWPIRKETKRLNIWSMIK